MMDGFKDRQKKKPNPPFDVRSVQPQIDAFIESLPKDQCHLVVNLKGDPYIPDNFRKEIGIRYSDRTSESIVPWIIATKYLNTHVAENNCSIHTSPQLGV
jgi:hypothetical protein